MVWLLERVESSCPHHEDSFVSPWVSQVDAQKEACDNILLHILTMWDLSREREAREASAINDLVAQGNLQEAIDRWNDCELNAEAKNEVYWYVYKFEPQSFPGAIRLIEKHRFG